MQEESNPEPALDPEDKFMKAIQWLMFMVLFFSFLYLLVLMIQLSYDVAGPSGYHENYLKAYKLFCFNKYIREPLELELKHN
jgi:hypothetical protein